MNTTLTSSSPRNYWHGGPAETYLRGMGPEYIAKNCAAQMRELAAALPDNAPDAERRRACLLARAAEIDEGKYHPVHHFEVFVPFYRKSGLKGLVTRRELSYPCRGFRLYTFDEAWLLLEAFASKEGYDCDDSCWAEGRGQNMDLDCIYDGIADPCRAVPDGPEFKI